MNEVIEQTIKQLSNFWNLSNEEKTLLGEYYNNVNQRCMRCFQSIDNKYFRNSGGGKFDAFWYVDDLFIFPIKLIIGRRAQGISRQGLLP